MNHVSTVCTHCGDGCKTTLGVRSVNNGSEILRGDNRDKSGINGDFLCIKGRYAFDFANHTDRLTKPLVRQPDGKLAEASWEQALEHAGRKLREIRERDVYKRQPLGRGLPRPAQAGRLAHVWFLGDGRLPRLRHGRILLRSEKRNSGLVLRQGGPLMDSANEKDSVLQAHAQNHAIAALVAAKPACITNARFDRGELTLWIERDDIRPVCRTLQKAGYNFLIDVTCVDWYPSEPRLQVTYHILSHSLKERIRLCVMVDTLDPEVASITPEWPSANFYEREVWDLFLSLIHI